MIMINDLFRNLMPHHLRIHNTYSILYSGAVRHRVHNGTNIDIHIYIYKQIDTHTHTHIFIRIFFQPFNYSAILTSFISGASGLIENYDSQVCNYAG